MQVGAKNLSNVMHFGFIMPGSDAQQKAKCFGCGEILSQPITLGHVIISHLFQEAVFENCLRIPLCYKLQNRCTYIHDVL